MIIVAGSPRSGTSLWMQILKAAGLPVLGERFPQKFSKLTPLNPEGFWESRLRMGVNFTSNPDPETGTYLPPEATQNHALKIFATGLVRTDVAFLDRVLITVRPWREFVASITRLRDAQAAKPTKPADPIPAAVAWWFQLHGVIRDVSTRRYPHRLITHGRLMRNPEQEIRAALAWLGQGDPEAAVVTVRPELHTVQSPDIQPPEGVSDDMVAVFDAVYAALDTSQTLESDLIRQMNDVQKRLRERWPVDTRPHSRL